MLPALDQIASDPSSTDLAAIGQLVARLRPARNSDPAAALGQVLTLTRLLHDNPRHAAALRSHLLHLLATRRQAGLYTDTGILSNDGFLHELRRRLAHVARHAGRVVHDGAAAADQPIEQRRLADIGPPDDGDPLAVAGGGANVVSGTQ